MLPFTKKILFWGLGFLLSHPLALAQKKNEAYQYHLHRASGPIEVDGVLDEPAWTTTEVATDFFMVLPMDTSRARLRTEVRMTYDDRFLYISAVNFQEGPVMVESLRRDFNFGRNDNFIFFLDPFDDQTNGFSFGANAAGAEWDGQQADGGSVNLNWDNRWFSKVKRTADRWTFEAAIPFKTLRYKAGTTRWGINFSRNDLTTTEKSAWAPVPRQFPTASLAYTGVLVWDNPPPKPGPNIAVLPYVLAAHQRSERPQPSESWRGDVGGDAKVALTSSLNLDLTVNPDFSQVEVDRQVTNLDRFELFFPERRQFFLENSDLFSSLGNNTLRPFFSRRIGLNTPIRYGARLSGRLNKDWRLGVMDVQTAPIEAQQTAGYNFAVASVQRRLFSRSNLTGFFINKQATGAEKGYTSSRYQRNGGLEANLASRNEVWRSKLLYYRAFGPQLGPDAQAASGSLRYSTKRLTVDVQQEYIGQDYNPETGFVPRRGLHKTTYSTTYLFFPKSKQVLSHSVGMSGFTYFAKNNAQTIENEHALFYGLTFRTQATLRAWVANNYTELLAPFDPTQRNGQRVEAGTRHNWNAFGTSFTSMPQRLFTYGWETRYGGYFANGTRLRLAANAAYRVQPYGSVALTAEYNDIQFPAATGLRPAHFWLVGPRVDVTLRKTLYFTTFVQYNEQIDNVNINTRFQWRYAPASDLFFVYTDNYLPDGFGLKQRAFVLKCTYWWNI